MPGRSFRIGRIAGIPIGISPWWVAIVGFLTWSLGAYYFPETVSGISPALSYALGLASALLLFASILAHELGHAVVARRHGIAVEGIDLWLLGGVSKMRSEAHEPGQELRYALAGPAVSAVIALIFGLLALLLPSSTPEVITALVEYQFLVNALILVFNMIPAFPLDGGRVLRSVLWRRSGEMQRATATAAAWGRVFGWALIALGVVEVFAGGTGGLWLALVGVFIVMAAGAQARGSQVQAALSGIAAGRLMSSPAVSIDGELSVAEAAGAYFVPYGYTAFPVIDGAGRAQGLLSIETVQGMGEQRRRDTSALAAADGDPALFISEEEDVAELLGRPAFMRVGRAVVIDAERRPRGLLSVTDVQRAVRASALTGSPQ